MKLKKIIIFILLNFSIFCNAQNFYNTDTIQKIEIFFEQADWDYQLDILKLTTDEYLTSKWVIINGVKFDSAGVKYKGNSSYDSSNLKNSIHIELNNIKEQNYNGYTDIKLNNGFADPSMIREVLAFNILSKYMDCPKSNFAEVYINGKYFGIYSNSESINKTFVKSKFQTSNNSFIKCNPIVTPGPTVKSNLKFINNDSNSYFNFYELKSKRGWTQLVNLCDTLSNYPSNSHSVIDIDRVIWMLAFNNLLVNMDSYNGVFAQNYYLYKDYTNRFNPIIWDLNMAFGAFPFAGSPGSGMGTLSITQMQQLSPDFHRNHTDWPLINIIFSNSIYRKMYYAHLKTILNENFTNKNYMSITDKYRATIDNSVKNDDVKFYTYDDFANGNTKDVNIGNYTVPGIKNLMDYRVNYINGLNEITYTQPEISLVKTSPETPVYNSKIIINAKVTNTISDSVWLGYRFSNTDKFIKIKMYDDGNHDDGSLGDNIYGINLTMTSANLQYFIYAENSGASIFSPERAEHEFYNANVPIDTVKKGDIVINEFLAINDKSDINEYGAYTDWIELYNTTDKTLNLSGYLLSDKVSEKGKFTFATNTFIYPKSFLIIWADDFKNSQKGIHSQFSLSGDGGQVVLCKSDSTILDSITYSAQSTDISTGRCPDGYGTFIEIEIPSFKSSNNVVCKAFGLKSINKSNEITFFPNPAANWLEINSTNIQTANVQIFDCLGKVIIEKKLENYKTTLNTEKINSGIYFYKIYNNKNYLIKMGKIVISK
ncbi:MAG: CotH kinase family protein [Bacteroidetes bacterium]|nr:CotH kinase family protein [Bacteroidota bacterium]